MAHESLMPLSRAAADNDAISEERGVEAVLADLRLDIDDVRYVSEQRALRAVMLESGRQAELRRAHAQGASRPQGFALTPREQMRMAFYQAIYMDGIAIGVRAMRDERN